MQWQGSDSRNMHHMLSDNVMGGLLITVFASVCNVSSHKIGLLCNVGQPLDVR